MKQIYKIKRPSWLLEKPRKFNKLWLDKNISEVVKEAVKEELENIAKKGMKK